MAGSLARYRYLGQFESGLRISTMGSAFPQPKIFCVPDFAQIFGVVSLHRKRNLPAEESGTKVLKRIGNETHEGGEEAFTAR
jgi:hypothetical protein